MPEKRINILVIRHGALGDVVLSTGAFAAIRQHHKHAHITLLTTPPYAKLLENSPYFNAFVLDDKPKFWKLGKLWKLATFFSEGNFSRVYDLQTSTRSSWYYHLLPTPKPEFSGLAKGASHRHHTPERTKLHTLERQTQQLEIAGITDVPMPDVSWLSCELRVARGSAVARPSPERGDLSSEALAKEEATAHCGGKEAGAGALKENYALLVPGGSAHRLQKRWPTEHYAELAAWLCEQGIQPVLIGTGAEADILDSITSQLATRNSQLLPLNLCNQTSLADIAELARRAKFAVGNDTGPMHLIAASGCPSVVLFSAASNPDLCAPRGGCVTVLRRDFLADLTVAEVISKLP